MKKKRWKNIITNTGEDNTIKPLHFFLIQIWLYLYWNCCMGDKVLVKLTIIISIILLSEIQIQTDNIHFVSPQNDS